MMKIRKMIDSPVLTAMHPGNPHGLRFAEGDGDDKGTGSNDGKSGDDDGSGDDLGDLLNPDDDPDEQDDDDPDEGDDDDGDAETVTVTRADLADMIERAVDRRINKKVQSRIGRGNRGGTGGGQRGGQYRPSSSDVREAKGGYRETLNDQGFKFVSPEERKYAQDLAEARIARTLSEGDDPYEVGIEVAEEVASSIKALRKSYEKQVIGRLEQRGVIKKPAGQRTGNGTRKTDDTKFTAGAARAQRMYADRLPQQSGDRK